ncbi:MAG TPA: discoidin domain-containing protein [Polyangiaceae bacterium]|nr:discoidin domain-containing protein [Polyangiaceae bacterium]
MSFVSPLIDPIAEFFTLRRAERTVRAYVPAQSARVRRHVDAAEKRLRAGRRLTDATAAAVLLREAVLQYLIAMETARDAGATEDATASLPALPRDPARPRADPSDDARVRAAIASRDPLYFDGLSSEDVERARWALDRAASMLRGHVESRTLVAVRGTRWGRLAAVTVLVLWGVLALAKAKLLPKNVAYGKPVHPSSLAETIPDGRELVDGDTGDSYAFKTREEDMPNVVIDLGGIYWLDTIKVHNRVDGWFDDCLPLVVEVSRDGNKWDEVARRERHFDANPPWVVDAGGRGARFVRLRVARHASLALSEVEVYGKPGR